jgi:hypothetical protein
MEPEIITQVPSLSIKAGMFFGFGFYSAHEQF